MIELLRWVRVRCFWLAAAAVGLASAGCGEVDVTGHWSGSWRTNGVIAFEGAVDMDLGQDEHDEVTGDVSLGSTLCVPAGDFVGTVDRRDLEGHFTNGSGDVEIEGTVDASGDEIRGSFEVTAGGCAGTRGTFEMSR